jgi:hypothetical protein
VAIEFRPPMSLFVSLARNDVDLARAAVDAGADALKVHMNVGHRASGTEFGSFAQERDAFTRILELDVPVGLVVGGEGTVDLDDVRAARELGFAFFDVYLHHAPAWYVEVAPEGGAVAALAHDHPLERAASLEAIGLAAVEASLAAPEDYGTALHLDRVADIARLHRLTSLPVVLPSQHAITPDDVPVLHDTGIAALLIGAVVTGTTTVTVGEATERFRTAIDRRS